MLLILIIVMKVISTIVADGHFVLLKFTTNWRCGFGTPCSRDDIGRLAVGKTASSAMLCALTDPQKYRVY